MRKILLLANNDWQDFPYQRQQFAMRFARKGHGVWYFNRTLQSWPTLYHLKQRVGKPRFAEKQGHMRYKINIVTPFWLPPVAWLRPINRILVGRTLKQVCIHQPVLITYVPTYNTLEVIRRTKPILTVYINVHNYDADRVVPDLLVSERVLARKADLLLADSALNRARMAGISGGRPVYPSEPGVDFELFHKAFRGDEKQRGKTICYFGGIGPHLDLSLYGELARCYTVFFIGVVNPAIKKHVPKNIEVLPPVDNRDLPHILRKADAIAILYKKSPYIDGVIPAKLYECLATGKPLLISGLSGLEELAGALYDVNGDPRKAVSIMSNLNETETNAVRQLRLTAALEADWSRRFESLYRTIDDALREKTGKGTGDD